MREGKTRAHFAFAVEQEGDSVACGTAHQDSNSDHCDERGAACELRRGRLPGVKTLLRQGKAGATRRRAQQCAELGDICALRNFDG